jgi:hypothetical protein
MSRKLLEEFTFDPGVRFGSGIGRIGCCVLPGAVLFGFVGGALPRFAGADVLGAVP